MTTPQREAAARAGRALADEAADTRAMELARAAHLLRSAGYAVVPASERDRMHRAIDEAHRQTVLAYDRHLHLLWTLQRLADDASRHLAPSRPRWLREARSFLHNHRWEEPIVGPEETP